MALRRLICCVGGEAREGCFGSSGQRNDKAVSEAGLRGELTCEPAKSLITAEPGCTGSSVTSLPAPLPTDTNANKLTSEEAD